VAGTNSRSLRNLTGMSPPRRSTACATLTAPPAVGPSGQLHPPQEDQGVSRVPLRSNHWSRIRSTIWMYRETQVGIMSSVTNAGFCLSPTSVHL
jgi:hypothetical protein